MKAANGTEGLVPSNYVEKVAAPVVPLVETPLPAPPLPVPPAQAPAPAPTMIKALHLYAPTAPNQIAMAQGETLTLLDGVGNWWKVRAANGTEGLVPSNYVEKVVAPVTVVEERVSFPRQIPPAPAALPPAPAATTNANEVLPPSTAAAAAAPVALAQAPTTAAKEAPLPVGPTVSAATKDLDPLLPALEQALPAPPAVAEGSAATPPATTTAPTSVVDEGDEEDNPFADEEADQENAIYEALYKKKVASTTDDLGAAEAAALLKESGLDQKALRSVWNAAKKDPAVQHGSKGKMNFDEFVCACKLAEEAGGTFAENISSEA